MSFVFENSVVLPSGSCFEKDAQPHRGDILLRRHPWIAWRRPSGPPTLFQSNFQTASDQSL